MNRGARIVTVLLALVALSLSSCGGGGGGGSSASPYTGLATPAVITTSNADNIARQAFQGGDLGANAVIPLAPAGEIAAASPPAGPAALALVRTVSKTAMTAVRPPGAAEGPSLRAPFTESGVISDGLGGEARYTISGDDATGAFTGTFAFVNFRGDGGGIIEGTVSVSGTVTQDSIRIRFNFQSVQVVDMNGGSDVTAVGTVDLTASLVQVAETGTATLDLFLTDNFTLKTVWLSHVVVGTTVGTGYSDTTLSGLIYLHDYGYVEMETLTPFHYLTGNSYPSSGQFVVTGKDNKKVQLTVVDTTRFLLDVDTNGDDLWEVTAVVAYW